MTEYIQVDRDQLRVGMRFDYRSERETEDLQVTRTITSLHPIAYDYTTQFGNGQATLTDLDLSGRKFYVHPDDLYLNETAHDAAYEKGVRDGYLKAQQEQGAKPTGEATRRRFSREDALTWAIQALTGSHDGLVTDLIPLAQQIERYVNGNDDQGAAPASAPAGLKVGDRIIYLNEGHSHDGWRGRIQQLEGVVGQNDVYARIRWDNDPKGVATAWRTRWMHRIG